MEILSPPPSSPSPLPPRLGPLLSPQMRRLSLATPPLLPRLLLLLTAMLLLLVTMLLLLLLLPIES